jgi:hypothetical protein
MNKQIQQVKQLKTFRIEIMEVNYTNNTKTIVITANLNLTKMLINTFKWFLHNKTLDQVRIKNKCKYKLIV